MNSDDQNRHADLRHAQICNFQVLQTHSSHESVRVYVVMLPSKPRNKAMAQRSRRPAMRHASRFHRLIAQDCEITYFPFLRLSKDTRFLSLRYVAQGTTVAWRAQGYRIGGSLSKI